MVNFSKVSNLIKTSVANIAKIEADTKQIDSNREVNELSGLLSGAGSKEDKAYLEAMIKEGKKTVEKMNPAELNPEPEVSDISTESERQSKTKKSGRASGSGTYKSYSSLEKEITEARQSAVREAKAKGLKGRALEAAAQKAEKEAYMAHLGETYVDNLGHVRRIQNVVPNDNYEKELKEFNEGRTSNEPKRYYFETRDLSAARRPMSSFEEAKDALREADSEEREKLLGNTFICSNGMKRAITGWNENGPTTTPCADWSESEFKYFKKDVGQKVKEIIKEKGYVDAEKYANNVLLGKTYKEQAVNRKKAEDCCIFRVKAVKVSLSSGVDVEVEKVHDPVAIRQKKKSAQKAQE